MTPLDKNLLYHSVLDILKQSPNQQNAAKDITMMFEQYLDDKIIEDEQKVEDKTSGKVSPIFRRST